MTDSRNQSRFRLVETIWPAIALLEREKSSVRRARYDFEVGRQRLIARLTGEDGKTLAQGGPPSIPSVRELDASLRDMVTQLEQNPELYGVQLFSGESEGADD